MHVDLMTSAAPLRQIQDLARDAADAGFSGIVVTEAGRTAYLSCAAIALAAEIDILTGVAVAFPRSPMVTAQSAWELAETTGGRFRLGLGTQVRAHVERRYGSSFDPPGPRLREYVEALRAIFKAFRGEKLAFDGEFYKLSLLTPQWSPGNIQQPDPAIDVAAVNPWMLRMAGAVADGVHVHPLNTATYLRETVVPNVAEGAKRAGRDPGDVQLIVPCFTAVGDTDDERSEWREMARMQVSFYGSTPNYRFIFEQLGADDLTDRIRERQKAGDIGGMAKAVPDDVLDHFVVSGTWDELPDRLMERYAGTASRVVFYFAGMAWMRDRSSLAKWGKVAATVRSASA